jgi:lysophospholipase L1-like esterase
MPRLASWIVLSIAVALLGPASLRAQTAPPAAPVAPTSPTKWEPDIAKFEAADRSTPPPASPVVFVGSSSIRKWNLETSWPGEGYLNRGFGGSELSDSVYYFDRIVKPYHPKAIVVYAGDNDFGKGATAAQVVERFAAFAAKAHAELPGTPVLFIAIKPSRKRWALWPQIQEANRAIAALCDASPDLDYADIATPMLATGAPPQASLFESDGLHMSAEGYALWKGVLQPWLDQHAH